MHQPDTNDLYLVFTHSRPALPGEPQGDEITEESICVGPVRAIVHTYGGLRVFVMDQEGNDQECCPRQHKSGLTYVAGRWWSDYFVQQAPYWGDVLAPTDEAFAPPPGKEYRVAWEIDVSGCSALDAIQKARCMMPVPGSDSLATVFSVTDGETGVTTEIDLLADEEPE